MLNKEGINYQTDFEKIYFLKKHNRVIDALLNGSIDAGAAYDEVVLNVIQKIPIKSGFSKKAPLFHMIPILEHQN